MTDFQILKRLYNDYTKKYLKNIIISVFFTVLLAASTSAVAYLLDPAIKQLFIEQEKSYLYLIPISIVAAFAIKGSSLYIAKVIMIRVAEEVRKDIQTDMFASLIKADTKLVDNKHSGKFVTNLTNDVTMITNLSNHIPILTTIEMTKEKVMLVLNFLNHINCGENTLQVIIAQYAHQ